MHALYKFHRINSLKLHTDSLKVKNLHSHRAKVIVLLTICEKQVLLSYTACVHSVFSGAEIQAIPKSKLVHPVKLIFDLHLNTRLLLCTSRNNVHKVHTHSLGLP